MNKQLPNGVVTIIVVVAIFISVVVVAAGSRRAPASDFGTTTTLNGTDAAPIEGKTTDGKTFRLADYKGKVVLLNFWATWCGPCVMEIPDLIKAQNKYASRGFTIVGLSTDDELATATKYAKEAKINYPVLLMPESARLPYGGISAIPVSIIVNRQGKIVSVREGMAAPEDLNPEIEKWL